MCRKSFLLFSGGKLYPNRVEAEDHISSYTGSQLVNVRFEEKLKKVRMGRNNICDFGLIGDGSERK